MGSRVKALSVVLLLSTALAPISLFARQIEFSKEIPKDQIDILKADLQRDLSLVVNAQSLEIFNTSDFKDETLKKWLTDRVGYIIGEKEDPKIYAVQSPYIYPNQNLLPTLELPKPTPAPTPTPPPEPGSPAPKPKGKPTIVMGNIGTAIYLYGKKKQILLGMGFETETDKAVLSLNTPRVGVIQIGKGLFRILLDQENKDSIVNSYYRLATLFHEAHHSDGNGLSLGFTHALCPDGLYENFNACDRNANGPYRVQAEFLKQTRATCLKNQTCTLGEAELLALAATDSYSRILDQKILDATPE